MLEMEGDPTRTELRHFAGLGTVGNTLPRLAVGPVPSARCPGCCRHHHLGLDLDHLLVAISGFCQLPLLLIQEAQVVEADHQLMPDCLG